VSGTAIEPVKATAVQEWELIQRKANAFAVSPLVPEHLRNQGKDIAFANCVICLELAKLMNENPLVIMQNIHFVKGKPGWNASYMIARANASGYFEGGIRFKTTGKGESLAVTAYAKIKETGETIEKTVDMATAKAVGWAANEKYKQIPEQMLSYRAATFLVRLYCPQVMLGYHTTEELNDDFAASMPKAPALTMEAVTATGEVIEFPEPPAVANGALPGMDNGQPTNIDALKK